MGDRLGRIGGGVSLDPRDTVVAWGRMLDEKARLAVHLLDPSERQAIRQWQRRGEAFQAATGTLTAAGGHAPVATELATVLELADEMLAALTETCRDVEAARIQAILPPQVADLWRREAAWAVEELRRAQGAP